MKLNVPVQTESTSPTCEVTFNTLSSDVHNLLSFYENVTTILSGSNNVIHFSQISAIIGSGQFYILKPYIFLSITAWVNAKHIT